VRATKRKPKGKTATLTPSTLWHPVTAKGEKLTLPPNQLPLEVLTYCGGEKSVKKKLKKEKQKELEQHESGRGGHAVCVVVTVCRFVELRSPVAHNKYFPGKLVL